MDNHLLTGLTHDNTCLTPGEIIHPPERVQREEERERGNCNDVEDHPTDHIPLATQNEDEGLESVYRCDQYQGECGYGLVLSRRKDNKIDDL